MMNLDKMPVDWLKNERKLFERKVAYGVYMMCEIDKLLGDKNETRA